MKTISIDFSIYSQTSSGFLDLRSPSSVVFSGMNV